MSRKWTEEDTALRTAAFERKWGDAQRLKDSRPYIQMLAVKDRRSPPECLALDGVIVHIDNSWLLANMPPHFDQCRCTIRTLSDRQMIRDELSITEEHKLPLLKQVKINKDPSLEKP